MTPNEFRDVVAKVELRNPPFPCEMAVHNQIGNDDVCELHIWVTVPDRDTGKTNYMTHKFHVPASWPTGTPEETEALIVRWISGCLGSAFLHERDECFHYNGARVADPHAGEASP